METQTNQDYDKEQEDHTEPEASRDTKKNENKDYEKHQQEATKKEGKQESGTTTEEDRMKCGLGLRHARLMKRTIKVIRSEISSEAYMIR